LQLYWRQRWSNAVYSFCNVSIILSNPCT
jgi:hypothetical protein